MKLMISAPVRYLDWIEVFGFDAHLVLSHLLMTNKKYLAFYKRLGKKGHWITIDNGVAETGNPLGASIDLLDKVHASEVVAPDYLFDAEKTLKDSMEFARTIRAERPDVKIMGVPQGRNQEDFYRCLESMYDSKLFDTIGIGRMSMKSIWAPSEELTSVQKVVLARFGVLSYLMEQGMNEKPIHILGLADPDVELPFYKMFNVRSVDSSYPFRMTFDSDSSGLSIPEVKLDPDQLYKALSWLLNHKQRKL